MPSPLEKKKSNGLHEVEAGGDDDWCETPAGGDPAPDPEDPDFLVVAPGLMSVNRCSNPVVVSVLIKEPPSVAAASEVTVIEDWRAV